jgi:SpoVK/Ycf46/Vps4 family AAA+-type ATPase
MLPKLAKLHDRGQLVFMMATNFQASFDDAIKRAGRFDFLLCMGPPTLRAKCESIHVFFELDKSNDETKEAGRLILEYAAANSWLEDQLSLYTYGEFLSFISGIGDATTIAAKVKALGNNGFVKLVEEDSHTVNLRMEDLKKLQEGLTVVSKGIRLKDLDEGAFDEASLKAKEINTKIPIIKYVLDRKQSKRQCTVSRPKVQN